MSDVKIEPGDKIWLAWPNRGLGQGWGFCGPYEPDAIPDDESQLREVRRHGFNGMLYYVAAAPNESEALMNARIQHREDCQRRRIQADNRAHEARQAQAQEKP